MQNIFENSRSRQNNRINRNRGFRTIQLHYLCENIRMWPFRRSKFCYTCWFFCWNTQINSHLRDTCLPLCLLSYRVRMDSRRVFIQLKSARYSRDNLTLIYERISCVSILFKNHLQRYTSTDIFHDNLTLPKWTDKWSKIIGKVWVPPKCQE